LRYRPIIIIALNLVVFLCVLWSLMIYSSLFKGLPWYEPSGMQFLIVLAISDPVFLITGVVLLILRKTLVLSKWNVGLPFLAAVGLSLPILVDGSLSRGMQISGIVIGIVLVVAVLVTTAKGVMDFRS
jgi:hypothetical protein